MPDGAADVSDAPAKAKSGDRAPAPRSAKRTPDTYWLLEGATLLLMNALGGLFVLGEENVPPAGSVLMVSNHTSYLDPCAIGDASPRRVVFMAKAELFEHAAVGFLLRGVDSFPVRRGEADRSAFKNTLAMLGEGRCVCIFPEGTRQLDGQLGEAEPGAGLFATRTGSQVVPVYVHNSAKMLDIGGRLHRAPITVTFGEPLTLAKTMDREEAGRALMAAVARTRGMFETTPAAKRRRIWPHWLKKPLEGNRAKPRS